MDIKPINTRILTQKAVEPAKTGEGGSQFKLHVNKHKDRDSRNENKEKKEERDEKSGGHKIDISI